MREVGRPDRALHAAAHAASEALDAMPCASYPAVLKADGLAAGKGVIICPGEPRRARRSRCSSASTASGTPRSCSRSSSTGEELSLLALCDGVRAVPMAPAQDYKRIFDGDQGPNTGGMGSYSPVPGIDADARAPDLRARAPADRRRAAPARTPFHGVLYAGLMMTADGPEGARVQRPLRRPRDPGRSCRGCAPTCSSLLDGAARPGGLTGVELEWSPDWAVTVVLASRGYPESSSKGDRSRSRAAAHELAEVEVCTRARRERDGAVVTAGGRVLNVTGHGGDARRGARARVRRPREMIEFEGKQMRRDIAARAVERVEA